MIQYDTLYLHVPKIWRIASLVCHTEPNNRTVMKKIKTNKSSAVAEMDDCLATTDMGQKGGLLCLFPGGAGPHLTQCAEIYLQSSIPSGILIHPAVWPQQTWPEKWGWCAPFYRGAGSQSNTMSPGLRPTSVPSGILIHPAVQRQQTLAENWGGTVFLGGGWVPI